MLSHGPEGQRKSRRVSAKFESRCELVRAGRRRNNRSLALREVWSRLSRLQWFLDEVVGGEVAQRLPRAYAYGGFLLA